MSNPWSSMLSSLLCFSLCLRVSMVASWSCRCFSHSGVIGLSMHCRATLRSGSFLICLSSTMTSLISTVLTFGSSSKTAKPNSYPFSSSVSRVSGSMSIKWDRVSARRLFCPFVCSNWMLKDSSYIADF